jgi:hypothetical protein
MTYEGDCVMAVVGVGIEGGGRGVRGREREGREGGRGGEGKRGLADEEGIDLAIFYLESL